MKSSIDLDESTVEKEATKWAIEHNYSIAQAIDAWQACLDYLEKLLDFKEEPYVDN